MGMWDFEPWDNDEAADWYAGLFEAENFVQYVQEALKQDAEEFACEIRAAAYVVTSLGRVYIWPIDQYDETLKLAIDGLSRILESEEFEESEELVERVKAEKELLEKRLNP